MKSGTVAASIALTFLIVSSAWTEPTTKPSKPDAKTQAAFDRINALARARRFLLDTRSGRSTLDEMSAAKFIRPESWYSPDASPEQAARAFYDVMRQRRSVRMFSPRPVSREAIELLVRSATTAPSGANKQPWRFICVQDMDLKRQIRLGAEQEECEFYSRRAGKKWLKDLEPLGTDENKAFLEIAPWLIVVFKLAHGDDASRVYYVNESVGIAVGMLLCAAQHAGLATLTHTPSPMKFLAQILGRPDNERPYLLIPIGYPADDLVVPQFAIQRKPLAEVMIVARGLASQPLADHANQT